MGIINKLARGVQNFTGETYRKQIVAQTKLEYIKSRKEIEYIVRELNSTIEKFNVKIGELNGYREKRVKADVEKLGSFLSTFGNIKNMSEYSEEKEKSFFNIPERAFEEVENYIADIDWSSDEVFLRTFFQGGVFASIFTRGKNVEMLARLEEFKNSVIDKKDKLNNKIEMIEKVDMRICDLYIELIKKL